MALESNFLHRAVSMDDVPPTKKRPLENANPSYDEVSLTQRRKRTRAMLEERLLRKALNENKNDDSLVDRLRIHRQAEAIEAVLFKQKLSCDVDDDHDEQETNQELNRSLILLLGKIVTQRERRRCRSFCNSKGSCFPSSANNNYLGYVDPRQEALKACLGTERYRQVKGMVGTIQQLGVDLTGHCYSRRPDRLSLRHGTMPDPVRRLFCETSLRTILDRTPIADLPHQDWDRLLSQAERHLKDYFEWLACSRKEQQLESSIRAASSCRCPHVIE